MGGTRNRRSHGPRWCHSTPNSHGRARAGVQKQASRLPFRSFKAMKQGLVHEGRVGCISRQARVVYCPPASAPIWSGPAASIALTGGHSHRSGSAQFAPLFHGRPPSPEARPWRLRKLGVHESLAVSRRSISLSGADASFMRRCLGRWCLVFGLAPSGDVVRRRCEHATRSGVGPPETAAKNSIHS